MKKRILSFVLFLCLLSSYNLFAQKDLGEVGKIYTKAEANKLFGDVKSLVKIKVSELKEKVKSIDKYVMFKIDRDAAIITDSKRNLKMAPAEYKLQNTDVMHLYSINVLQTLFEKSSDEYVSLEMREEVFSITYGDFTLERSVFCPPWCSEE